MPGVPVFLLHRIMKCILGEKIGMTQVFNQARDVVPVTLVRVMPNTVLDIRTPKRDGYAAVQLGMGVRKVQRIAKPQRGHFKELGNFKKVREFRVQEQPTANSQRLKRGDIINACVFSEGDRVQVSGVSKSKGFQGVVKRHNFRGAPGSHGTKHAHRQPGSIGATWPQRVVKGRRMAGRMGGERISVRNLKIERIDATNGIVAITGAVPGRRGTLLEIRG